MGRVRRSSAPVAGAQAPAGEEVVVGDELGGVVGAAAVAVELDQQVDHRSLAASVALQLDGQVGLESRRGVELLAVHAQLRRWHQVVEPQRAVAIVLVDHADVPAPARHARRVPVHTASVLAQRDDGELDGELVGNLAAPSGLGSLRSGPR
jgi:hypothetical protein